ncbi:hypothetical protein [Microbaculum marinum]|uniref:Uncharacterized protein n=1 Tax=Microbaculum marinum TaxID=1764581 RepID=A0AAW9RRB6_9HYPH
MRHAMPLLFILVAASGTAEAEPLDALTGDGRYQLMEINDKVVRLDTRSGRFELCRMENGNWTCLVAQDERQRLEDTVAALSSRVDALEAARRQDKALARASGPLATPVTVSQPKVAEAAPVTPSSVTPAPVTPASGTPASGTPAPTAPAASLGTRSIAAAPVPAEPVPSVRPGGLDPGAHTPAATGEPFDISPGATVAAAEERPGLFDRITGLLPSIGW